MLRTERLLEDRQRTLQERPRPVSYTHLDVYKRQVVGRVGHRLARATEVAAAILDVLAFDQPIAGHVNLLP